MKIYVFVFLSFANVFSCLYGQERQQTFIAEITRVYNSNQCQFQRESEKVMKKYLESQEERKGWKKSEQYNFLFMPQLLLRRSRRLYENIDSTNLIQYFNPRSMFYHRAFVSVDSQFIGQIFDHNIRGMKKQFRPKPQIDSYVFERLFKQLVAINPDIVFTVQNIEGYFFIKENRIFVLAGGDRGRDFVIYCIDEYTEKNREIIFDFWFRYTPRVRYVMTCC